MFLKSVSVCNFRSLKDIYVELESDTILIGENNSGKTAFLDILRSVLSRVTATATFDEYDYFAGDGISVPQDSPGIKVVFTFSERTQDEWHDDIISKFQEITQPHHDDLHNIDLFQIIFEITSKYNEVTEQYDVSYNFLNHKGDPLQPKAKSLIQEFLKMTPVFYLQALRDSSEVFSGKSYMWGKFLKQVKFKPDDLESIQDSIGNLNRDIIEKDESLNQLVNSMSTIQEILDFNQIDTVAINALPIKSWDLLSKAQVVFSNNKELNLPLERHGQGTQSMAIVLLYEAYIKILLKKLYNKHSQAILTLEEPEAHLHPQAIRAFEKQLRQVECQKIVTTHSPYFIQNANIFQIRLFKKVEGKTKVYSIPKSEVMIFDSVPKEIKTIVDRFSNTLDLKGNALIAKCSITGTPEKSLQGIITKFVPDKAHEFKEFIDKSRCLFSEEEVYQMNSFVQKTRGELFFAKSWIMAEGQTESVIIPYFARKLGYDLDRHGVSYIEFRSNGSAKAFTKLAKVLNFEWTLLSDNDDQGVRTLGEIRGNGFTEDEISDRVRFTEYKDIEHELAENGFLSDYETILKDEITTEINELKENDFSEYKKKIAFLIQEGKGKVKNAYKLIEILESRKMSVEEIPDNFKYIIERLCSCER